MIYLLAFCRVATGLVFAISSVSKVRTLAQFQQAIFNFHFFSRWLSNLAALLFLGGELAVMLLMILGGPLLLPGFALAIVLLCIFCVALASVLIRKLHTSCNCFGVSEKPVAVADIWRNVGFLLCAGGGCEALIWMRGEQGSLAWMAWLFIVLGAAVFVVIWIQLGEIAHLLRR